MAIFILRVSPSVFKGLAFLVITNIVRINLRQVSVDLVKVFHALSAGQVTFTTFLQYFEIRIMSLNFQLNRRRSSYGHIKACITN